MTFTFGENTTFTLQCGEKFRFTTYKRCGENRFTNAVVKIHIYTTFTPCHGKNSDFHHAVVKIQIFMTFTPYSGKNSDFHYARGENSDFYDFYTTPW